MTTSMDAAGVRLSVLAGHLQPGSMQPDACSEQQPEAGRLQPTSMQRHACSEQQPEAGRLQPGSMQRYACSEQQPQAGHTAVICGAVVLDVLASSSQHALLKGGSVPGTVRQVPGGVARNIADAASQLVQAPVPPPVLVSAVGRDTAGQTLMDNLKSLRLDLSGVREVQGMSTASVCVVLDRGGEVACCVADVAGPEAHLSPALLSELLRPALPRARLLVVETNLSEDSVKAACGLAAAAGVEVVLEPVSVPKAVRAVSSLQHLAWITPNANELIAMADELCRRRCAPLLPRPPPSTSHEASEAGWPATLPSLLWSLLPFAALMLKAGMQRIVLTLGADGAALLRLATSAHGTVGASKGPLMQSLHGPVAGSIPAPRTLQAGVLLDIVHMPALPTQVQNTNGAGDTLVGALVGALLSGAGEVEAVAAGVAAAGATVACDANVAPTLGWAGLQGHVAQVLKGVTRVQCRC